ESLQTAMSKAMAGIQKMDPENISKKRSVWLEEKYRQQAIESVAGNIDLAIQTDKISNSVIFQAITAESDVLIPQVVIKGIRGAIETTANTDIDQAKALYRLYESSLVSLLNKAAPETRDVLSKFFCRLHVLGIARDETLQSLDIKVPDLSKSFSENLKSIE